MIIEVEIDDAVYKRWMEIFPEGTDLGDLLGSMCQSALVILATDPQAFFESFGEEAVRRLPDTTQRAYRRLVDKFLPEKDIQK